MPTRVVIRPPSPTSAPAAEAPHNHEAPAHESDSTSSSASSNVKHKNNANVGKTPISGVVGFRSSCRDGDNKHNKNKDLRLSGMDLRASPRLQGYLFMLVASVVNLVSVAKFYANRNDDSIEEIRRILQDTADDPVNDTTAIGDEDDSTYTDIAGNVVLTWKLYGAMAVSAVGVVISLFILFAHFDSVCYPLFWKETFRDGSKSELYILVGLFFFWAAGLHICTSTFSVGVVAPNVYFTTWIAFATVPVNFNVWRKGAQLDTLSDRLWSHPRETMHNWFFVFVFTAILALAASDLFVNRDDLEYLLDGEVQQIPLSTYRKGLCIAFASCTLAVINMVCDHYLTGSRKVRLCGCTVTLEWRQMEGIIALYLVGVSYWMVVEYTGVNFPLNGPSNAYFGAWGAFFSSIFTFGTWLHENKDTIELLTHEEGNDDDEDSSRSSGGAGEEAPSRRFW